MSTELVTVVVCTYNRAALVRDTLASLTPLETDGQFAYEVVVVDNASTDDTPAVIAETARNYPVPLRGVREEKAGVACARNRGIREARGTWIAFFDDDQVAHPCWLKELLAQARRSSARCVGGGIRLRLPAEAAQVPPSPCRALLGERVAPGARRYSRRWAPGAGNLMLHRSVFDQVGLFDETLREAGEDADLFNRLHAAKIEGWYAPDAVAYHVIPAYRLTRKYLRWKALLNGGHVARRNRRDWGRGMFLVMLAARLGQTAAVHLPRLLWARLRGAEDQWLGTRCLLWRVEGYVRFALAFLAPRLFAQKAFFSQLEFRSEREAFSSPVGSMQ
jgi:glycosyltransferase involved in cell wall biosynthesis